MDYLSDQDITDGNTSDCYLGNPQSIRNFDPEDMDDDFGSQIESIAQPQFDKWTKKQKLTKGQIKNMKKKAAKQTNKE